MAAKWSEEDTQLLIQVWAMDSMQKKLSTSMRNLDIFEKISRLLRERHGIERTAIQCRTKIKKLRSAFKRADDPQKAPFHQLLAPVLNQHPHVYVDALHPSRNGSPEGDSDDEDLPPEDDGNFSSHSDQSLNDVEIIQNLPDSDEEDAEDDASTDLQDDTEQTCTLPLTNPSIIPVGPEETNQSAQAATSSAAAGGESTPGLKSARKRKSPADATKAALDSALRTFKEISRDEMRAFNEAENERWEKWMRLEEDRIAREQRQDRVMISFLRKVFGGVQGLEDSD